MYEARLAALLAARNDRTDEHKRAQERYKKVTLLMSLSFCRRVVKYGEFNALQLQGLRCSKTPITIYRIFLLTHEVALFVCRAQMCLKHNPAAQGFPPLGLITCGQDCDDFDKKVEKLQSEKDRRMEECFNELASLEDGYRQKQRDAKQVSGAGAGSFACRVGVKVPP